MYRSRTPSTATRNVLELTGPDDIAHARELIARPDKTDAQIVVASISVGAGDLPNQDFLNGGMPWSWHLSEFIGFADSTIEILDGWPSFVESDVDGWISNTGGQIGFWNYTITQEVQRSQLSGMSTSN